MTPFALPRLRPWNTALNQPPLVFLPGMDGTGDLFHTQAPSLDPHFAVHSLQLPPYAYPDWLALVTATWTTLTQHFPDTPVVLCGESFGGCLALKLAAYAPERVAGLILVNPASSFAHQGWLVQGSRWVDWLPPGVFGLSHWVLLPFLVDLTRLRPADRQRLMEAMRAVPHAVCQNRLALLREFDLTPETLARLSQPTLILASAQDRLLPSLAEAERLVSHLPRATYEVLPNSGHACLLETDVHLTPILDRQRWLGNWAMGPAAQEPVGIG
ncbi:MAG: alpha/beta fold hydrolase [Gloeomargaritaceae cyanobacterium C42_A2020_066]|nr:alpha/beta fold hydrolase [Gloeomargaritaceae cyanobacterium C42_A2020_066]